MSVETVSAGDVLHCTSCNHERTISSHWIGGVVRQHFPKRDPKTLYLADLKRFRCSSCGKKQLELRTAESPVHAASKSTEVKGRQLAIAVISEASPLERELLLRWAQQLITIRNSNLSATEKAKTAISATIESKAIMPFLKTLGREIKRFGWDDRSLPARIGLSAAGIALLLPGKGAAGIAALGGAIGVPLWVVFGAGGAFAGVLIEEINRHALSDHKPKISDEKVIEGEVLEHNVQKASADPTKY